MDLHFFPDMLLHLHVIPAGWITQIPYQLTSSQTTDIHQHCWMFVDTKQRLWAQRGGRWCISVAVTVMWKTSHVPDGHAQLSHQDIKNILISLSTGIGILQPGNCVWNWILASVSWTQWWQHWNIAVCASWVPWMHTLKRSKHHLSGSIEPIQSWRWQSPKSHHYW